MPETKMMFFIVDIFVAVDEEELSTQLEGLGVGEHAFSQMQGDLDQQRLLGDIPTYNSEFASETMMKEMQNKIRYTLYYQYFATHDQRFIFLGEKYLTATVKQEKIII